MLPAGGACAEAALSEVAGFSEAAATSSWSEGCCGGAGGIATGLGMAEAKEGFAFFTQVSMVS